MSDSKVQWVVNDNGELGVLVDGEYYFLYKGRSLQYGDDPQDRSDDGIALHDDGTPMYVREVGKREFGETAKPLVLWISVFKGGIQPARYMEPLMGDDPPQWKPLPATKVLRHERGDAMSDAYTRLRAYADDLQARFVAQAAWKARHPDWQTFDDATWERVTEADPFPPTDDVVTPLRFLDMLTVALDAYERGGTR